MKKKWFVNLFLFITKITGFIPAYILLKTKVYRQNGAKRRLPKNCILVSNHKSLLDFLVYLMIFPFRTIHFLMAEVLYNKSKFFSFILNSWGGIRVDRDDKNFSFVSDAIEVLDNNGIVGVFPEGRLPINGKPWPFTTSTAFIAMHSDAPIVPVYTNGRYGLFKRARVCIGKPFYVSDYLQDGLTEQEQIEHLTKVIEEKVYELKDDIQRGMNKHRLFNFKNIPMDIARLVCSVFLLLLRVKRLTPEGTKYKKKIRGGAIIAANHTSYMDPFSVGVTFWYRRMHMLVAEVVMRTKLLSILIRGVGGIKIDRQCADIDSINKSIDKLKKGYLLTIFPQGGIDRQDEIDTIKSGAVLMAFRAGVPIVPMHILPRKHWFSRQVVIIGETINPKDFSKKKLPSTSDIKTTTTALMNELNRCKASKNIIFGGQQ